MRGGWRDMWLHPTVELAIGCVLLVLSAGFWLSANAGPIWSTRHWQALGCRCHPRPVFRRASLEAQASHALAALGD